MFDPYSREYAEDPYSVYARLREEAPVFHNTEMNFWALSRYEDVVAAHRDARTFCSSGGVTIEGLEAGRPLLILKDQPEHGIAKGFVVKMFSRARMEALDTFIRKRAVELLEALYEEHGASGECDLVSQFSVRLPLDVISELLGIPVEHRERIHHLCNRVVARGEGTSPEDAMMASMELTGLYIGLAAERRANPTDDVISMLIADEQVAEDGNIVTMSDEVIGVRFMELGFAGHETLAKAIPNGLMAFHHFPGQWKALVAEPSLMDRAIHEILRYDPPSHLQGRTTTRKVEMHGVTIPKGERVMLLTGSAVRDPDAFDAPESFDVTRLTDPRSVYFGFGVHKCLGIHLAQRELTIVFEELTRRFPKFSCDPSRAERAVMSNVRGVKNLPSKLGAHA
ncbi:cytochrome P450 [Erythrobacter litoralis]|uniref:cytochrome P450 n=1 Tax=Erythrobacter litoralis TaxID=39960 RepID=UPI0024355598|nr:cytochrome P450 [Erythrobacter litoralis]MDG6079888.1 cytochrome P450 [Erythrobacter litoralis]